MGFFSNTLDNFKYNFGQMKRGVSQEQTLRDLGSAFSRENVDYLAGRIGDVASRGISNVFGTAVPQAQAADTGQVSNEVARERFIQRMGSEPSQDQIQQEKQNIVDTVNSGGTVGTFGAGDVGTFTTGDTTTSSGVDLEAIMRQQEEFLQRSRTQANQYIDQLMGDTRGDYDLAVRILDTEHENALGTNDAKRAAFIEQVSSQLEQEIGQIPYDFNVASERLTTDRDVALQRLGEQEQLTRGEIDRQAEEARGLQAETLSQRGLLTGPRAETIGTGRRDVERLEGDVERELQALGRTVGREREDIGRGFGRGIEDVTTTARRGALGAGQALEFGTETAERARDKSLRQLERERQNILNQLEQFRFFGIGA